MLDLNDEYKKHGAFYSADPLWLDQVINWLYDSEK